MRRGSVEGGAVARASDRSDHKEIVVTTLTMSQWRAHPLTPILETTVGGVLRAAAWRAPDRVALIDGDRRWTYGELLDEAERAARGLLSRFAPGEPVAVWAGNGPDWVLLEFAAGLAGLTLVTVNPAYQAEELAHVLGHCGARGVFLRGGAQEQILAAVLARFAAGR
jgi:acyl-CoA synthetase (AMP-forming)/AMP-acid ligase II